jgi:hypothetical protein
MSVTLPRALAFFLADTYNRDVVACEVICDERRKIIKVCTSKINQGNNGMMKKKKEVDEGRNNIPLYYFKLILIIILAHSRESGKQGSYKNNHYLPSTQAHTM